MEIKMRMLKLIKFTFYLLLLKGNLVYGGLDHLMADNLEIKDWFALGSGCRGREGGVGDVRINLVNLGPQKSVYRVEIDWGSFELDGFQPVNEGRATFARECSLRMAFYPSKGFKIKNVSFTDSIKVKKAPGVDLTLYSKLSAGNEALSIYKKKFIEDRSFNKTIDLGLFPTLRGREILRKVKCSEPKIFGVDLSFLNKREDIDIPVHVKPKGKGTSYIQVEIEECS